MSNIITFNRYKVVINKITFWKLETYADAPNQKTSLEIHLIDGEQIDGIFHGHEGQKEAELIQQQIITQINSREI